MWQQFSNSGMIHPSQAMTWDPQIRLSRHVLDAARVTVDLAKRSKTLLVEKMDASDLNIRRTDERFYIKSGHNLRNALSGQVFAPLALLGGPISVRPLSLAYGSIPDMVIWAGHYVPAQANF